MVSRVIMSHLYLIPQFLCSYIFLYSFLTYPLRIYGFASTCDYRYLLFPFLFPQRQHNTIYNIVLCPGLFHPQSIWNSYPLSRQGAFNTFGTERENPEVFLTEYLKVSSATFHVSLLPNSISKNVTQIQLFSNPHPSSSLLKPSVHPRKYVLRHHIQQGPRGT